MQTRLTLAVALVASLAAQSRLALADDFTVDGAHTSIIFGISHMGMSFTYGRFNKATGAYTLDATDPAKSKFQLAIDAASIDTNNPGRDKHLMSPDFLNTGEFPVITFESTKVSAKQNADKKTVYSVTGDMTMHGVKKEITLELIKLGEGQGPGGKDYRSGFLCDVKLMRSEFGMTNMLPGIGDEVAITISFEGIKK
jgi:polyisoprenoid-binding protein YceI